MPFSFSMLPSLPRLHVVLGAKTRAGLIDSVLHSFRAEHTKVDGRWQEPQLVAECLVLQQQQATDTSS